MSAGKRVMITGGLGFIGRNVAGLLGESCDVTVLDINGPRDGAKNFVKVDLLDPKTIPDLSGYDAVIHLAAMVGVSAVEKDPCLTLDVNINSTRNVLEACRKGDVGTVLFPSSSEVYGEPLKLPIYEEDYFSPISAYGVSKMVGEEYVKSFSKVSGMKFNIFRLFNVYGEGQSNQFVIPRFVKLALENKTLVVHGDGKQVRAFCHVRDVAEAMKIGIEKPKNEIFNIGNPNEPINMVDLAKRIVKNTGSKSGVSFVKHEDSGRGREKDVMNRVPHTGKAKKVLGFEAEIGLDDGIKKVADYLRGR